MWIPERIFFSHATKDSKITDLFTEAFKKYNNNFELYKAERVLVGKPLIEKLKDEILNSNGIVVVWTKNTKKENTRHIISFEIGMAYSLGLPIYLFYINYF